MGATSLTITVGGAVEVLVVAGGGGGGGSYYCAGGNGVSGIVIVRYGMAVELADPLL